MQNCMQTGGVKDQHIVNIFCCSCPFEVIFIWPSSVFKELASGAGARSKGDGFKVGVVGGIIYMGHSLTPPCSGHCSGQGSAPIGANFFFRPIYNS